jgi:predicted 3-demethylubiquinone-9 3-methyltransferase (glyoxalase superfamily)
VPKKITIFLWYNGKAQQAAKLYTSIFKKSKNTKILDSNPMSTTFTLEGREFVAFNGGPAFKFTEATSFFVSCKTQQEVDYYWKKLSAGGKIQRCGWLKDRFGVSWQIVPSILGDLIGDDDREKANRAIRAMMGMKKLDIAKLKKSTFRTVV